MTELTNLTEFTNLTNMTNLTITQIIGMYQHIAQLLQPLREITISLFPNMPNAPSLPDLPYPISPTASQSTAEGFSTGTALRDFTDFPNPRSAESIDGGKAAAYPKGGFTAPYSLPQFYGYSVLNSGSLSANVEFFTAVNPDIFGSIGSTVSTGSIGSSGSATINPTQKTLNNITKQYSTAVTKSTSAINPIFTENSFSRVDFFSDNGLNSDVFQNSSITENHLQKAVFSPHKGEELRQAVKTASSSSVYNGGTEIRVDMSGMRNTVNSRTDLDELIDRLCTELSQAALSAAEGVHF